ncbi:DUF6799 domain-containing protein [Parafilimonas terrae]|uniref:DUF6799 domain-containing protein n=1 Tax=Parafilimonas terrae TaxID=1465490 RepID=A0A1I5VMH3_9BACT|nr:DUF6799 domain-containing protein [Parafilimonas terrae]SFQ08768.1 hypothetical protein SAMN05444277_10586 [Parafilimonas terrae]
MKKFIPVVFMALLAACNSSSSDTSAEDTMVVMPDTDITADTTTVVATEVYTPSEGDVIYKDGKTMVMRNDDWVVVDKEITLDNGVVVYNDGTVKRDKAAIKLEEGEVVNKAGNFFDKTGKAIDNAWQDTKDAVKDAGQAVGDAAKKAGKKIDTIFDKKK